MKFVFSIASIFALASGMGYMEFPLSRNVNSYCPQCANGFGVCGNGLSSQWNDSMEPSNRLSSTVEQMTVLYAGGSITIGIYIMASAGGVAVLELCTNPGDVIEESCFKRLERDPGDVKMSPYLDNLPTHLWFTTDTRCTDIHTPAMGNPLRFTFKIPDDAVSEHAILRFNWQTSTSCCAHPSICDATFDDRLKGFGYKELIDGEEVLCTLEPSLSPPCGGDCPNAKDFGCNVSNSFIRNCADVVIRSKNECSGDALCPNVREGNEAIVYPGNCGAKLTGNLEDCNAMRAFPSADSAFCAALCQELFVDHLPSYSLWCKLHGHCHKPTCAAAYSWGKCWVSPI